MSFDEMLTTMNPIHQQQMSTSPLSMPQIQSFLPLERSIAASHSPELETYEELRRLDENNVVMGMSDGRLIVK